MFVLYPVIRLTPSFEERVQRFHKCETKLASLKADFANKKDMLTTEQSQELLAIINDCEAKLDALRADITKHTTRNFLFSLPTAVICIVIILAELF